VHGIQNTLSSYHRRWRLLHHPCRSQRWRLQQELSLRAVPCMWRKLRLYDGCCGIRKSIGECSQKKSEPHSKYWRWISIRIDGKRLSVQLIPELMNRYNESRWTWRRPYLCPHAKKHTAGSIGWHRHREAADANGIIVKRASGREGEALQEKAAMMDQLESLQEQFAKWQQKIGNRRRKWCKRTRSWGRCDSSKTVPGKHSSKRWMS